MGGASRLRRMLAAAVTWAVAAACVHGAEPAPPQADRFTATQETVHVHSDSFKADFPAVVALPAGYANPANAGARYPLLILLHGADGTEKDWANMADLKATAAKYGRIVVSPTCGPNSWWCDYAGTPANFAETFVTKELLAGLKAKFRVADDGKHWITGNSMGGYGGLRIGLGHPELFSAVGGLSPCVHPARWGRKWGLDRAMGPPGGRASLFGTEQLKALTGRKGLVLSVLCGGRDLFIKENRAAHQALKAAGAEHQWLDMDGNHNAEFWSPALLKQLEYFQERERKVR